MGIPMEFRALWNHVSLNSCVNRIFFSFLVKSLKEPLIRAEPFFPRFGISLNLVASPSFLVLRHLNLQRFAPSMNAIRLNSAILSCCMVAK